VATPGGWNIVGRTPLRLAFDAGRDPTLLHCGDAVRFVAIDRSTFGRIAVDQGMAAS
jgi:inhibitor of KinA